MSGEQDRDALVRALMIAVLVPGPLRVSKTECVVLTNDEAVKAADAILASDWLADLIAQAEQRGRVEALREAADDLKSRMNICCATCQYIDYTLRSRADRADREDE